MAVLDEDNLKHGGAQIVAKLPAPTPGASTTLAPGPMELGVIASATSGSKSDQCARCKGYGHWSPACGTPRSWKHGGPVASRPLSANLPSEGGKGKPGPWDKGGKSQVYNTEAEDAQGDSEDRDSGSEADDRLDYVE